MSYIHNEDFGVSLVRNTPDGELHAKRHMDICRAVDLTKLSIVLEQMVQTGYLSNALANAFQAQAGGLLATMLSENHRSFIGSQWQSTASEIRLFGLAALTHPKATQGEI